MINNLADYFMPQQEFYLDNISYSRLEKVEEKREYSMNCTDNLEFKLEQDSVRITVKRTLNFDPEEIFYLSVSFGVILRFNASKKADFKWEEINLAEEFKENGEFVLSNIMNRISLLIAQITASFGQPPIVLPPGLGSVR